MKRVLLYVQAGKTIRFQWLTQVIETADLCHETFDWWCNVFKT